jgi:hypothetical protein
MLKLQTPTQARPDQLGSTEKVDAITTNQPLTDATHPHVSPIQSEVSSTELKTLDGKVYKKFKVIKQDLYSVASNLNYHRGSWLQS